MIRHELLETIELLERMHDLKLLWIDDTTTDPLLQMGLFLLRRHLTGRLTTPTSLAQAAGVPYTTATRRVKKMQDDGLVELRPRTKSGLSYYLHPRPKLNAQLSAYLNAVRHAVQSSSTAIPATKRGGDTDTHSDYIRPPSLAPASLVEGEFGFERGLNILVLDDPAYWISQRLRRELSYLMGGKVRFEETSIDGLRERVLANAEEPESQFDVIAVDLPTIAEFAEIGVLAPLDNVAVDSSVVSADFLSAAWRGTIVKETQYAIPVLINPQLLFVRRDFLNELGEAPPSTTKDLLRIAKRFHDPARGRHGVSWTAARGGPVGQAFIQFLADFGQPIFEFERSVDGYKTRQVEKGALFPTIDTERGLATAQFMRDLLKVSPPDTLDMSWDGQVALLREGKVAMAYEWAGRAAQLTGFVGVDELEFLPHPTGFLPSEKKKRQKIAPIGGFAFGIPKNISPSRLRTAWNAIEWLSSPEILKLIIQHGGHVSPRFSVGADPDVRELSPVVSAVDRMARRGEIRLWPRPPVSDYSSVVTILGEEIHDMLRGKQTAAAALKRSQERAEATMGSN